jgi:hypothetical protein
MDWIDLAKDRDRWRALVNAVMKILGSSCTNGALKKDSIPSSYILISEAFKSTHGSPERCIVTTYFLG